MSPEHLFTKNVDYEWINPTVFGNKLTPELIKMRDNGNVGDYYASTKRLNKMLQFKNEKGFQGFDSSLKSHRLLLMYSLWNVMQYWDVNKYLMKDKWSDILNSRTEAFLKYNGKQEFEKTKAELISKLNDSHSFYFSKTIADSLFKQRPFFSVKVINDSLVINGLYNQKLAKKDEIELGDIIVKIEHNSISSIVHQKVGQLLSASNPAYLKQYSALFSSLLFYSKDSINVDVVSKNGICKNKYIHLYKDLKIESPIYLVTPKKENYSLIQPDIAYLNLDKISKEELAVAFKQIANTKGVIIDLRNYPKLSAYELPKYLYPEKKEYMKVLFPIKKHPSLGEYDGKTPLHLIGNPFVAGKNNPDYYKGKVILLVNRRTGSHAEHTGMIIQQAPNCITIGEQTMGAVMNPIDFTMSDNDKINFTALGAYYPNGEAVQGKGLHIDYYITESAKNYDPELYINKAVKLIEKS